MERKRVTLRPIRELFTTNQNGRKIMSPKMPDKRWRRLFTFYDHVSERNRHFTTALRTNQRAENPLADISVSFGLTESHLVSRFNWKRNCPLFVPGRTTGHFCPFYDHM